MAKQRLRRRTRSTIIGHAGACAAYLRESRGKTQQEIADLLGKARTVITAAEANARITATQSAIVVAAGAKLTAWMALYEGDQQRAEPNPAAGRALLSAAQALERSGVWPDLAAQLRLAGEALTLPTPANEPQNSAR